MVQYIGNEKSEKEKVFEFHLEQIKVSLSNANKQFLYILEDLQEEYGFSDKEYQRYRKKILDHGGDASRTIQRCFGYYKEN